MAMMLLAENNVIWEPSSGLKGVMLLSNAWKAPSAQQLRAAACCDSRPWLLKCRLTGRDDDDYISFSSCATVACVLKVIQNSVDLQGSIFRGLRHQDGADLPIYEIVTLDRVEWKKGA